MSETTAPGGPDGVGGGTEGGETATNTLLNGVIGGAVAILLFFLPFSTVLGGAVAGYLEGGTSSAGAKAGAIAGAVSFVPAVLVGLFASFFLVVVPVGEPGVQLGLGVLALVIVAALAIYTVGLGLIGGVLGAYVKREVDL